MIEIFEPIRKTASKIKSKLKNTSSYLSGTRGRQISKSKGRQERATRRTENLNKHKTRVNNLIEARKNYASEKATLTKKLDSYNTHKTSTTEFKQAQDAFISERDILEENIKNAEKGSPAKKKLELQLIELRDAHKTKINNFLNPIKQSLVNTTVVSPDILLKQKSGAVETALNALSKKIDERKTKAKTELNTKINELAEKEHAQDSEIKKATEKLDKKLSKSRRKAEKFTKYMSNHKITGFAANAAEYFRKNPDKTTKDFISSLGAEGLKKFKSFRYKTAGLEAKADFIRSRVLYENEHTAANTIKTKAEKKLLEEPTTSEEFGNSKNAKKGKEKENRNEASRPTRDPKIIEKIKESITTLNQNFYNDMNAINGIDSTDKQDKNKQDSAIESKKKILLAKLFTKYKLDLSKIKGELGIDQTFDSIYTGDVSSKINGNVLDNITGSDGLNFFKDHFINPESQAKLHESMGIDTSKETKETKNSKEPKKTLENLEANFKDVDLKNGIDFILNEQMVKTNIDKDLFNYYDTYIKELEANPQEPDKIKNTKERLELLKLREKEFTEIEGYIKKHKAEYAKPETTTERKQELLGLITHQSEILLKLNNSRSIKLNQATTETASA